MNLENLEKRVEAGIVYSYCQKDGFIQMDL